MKRSRLQRKKPLVARVKPRRPGRRGPRPTTAEIAAREWFKEAVCSEPCIGRLIPGHVCDGPLQAMHVVSKHTLKRRGLRRLLWSVENGVCGCERVHRRHDLAVEGIPRVLLPARCLEFAREHGLMDALERHWPGTPFDDEVAA